MQGCALVRNDLVGKVVLDNSAKALIAVIMILLTGCGSQLTWQESLCEKAIRKEARYGYDLIDIGSKNNTLLSGVTDVVGTVTIKDGFGQGKVQSFRCSINNGEEETLTSDDVRVWIF